ncbi:uncharacterized protein MONBRDRAFT_566, partial [Monosiga brevicollis MX1]
YSIDDAPGLGLRWEGVGAISGGGATSKLLMDYDPQTVSDILDFLFLPNFGLSLQMLKVEIGGTADATEGAEPSHMQFPGDENYQRGYEWWLMKEAKKRNPDIKLYGLPWSWPGWLDPASSSTHQASNAFYNASLTANYTVAWLLGAQREHNLTIDYVGQWNERDAPEDYATALRQLVTQKAPATTVLNRLVHYPGTGLTPDAQGCKQAPVVPKVSDCRRPCRQVERLWGSSLEASNLNISVYLIDGQSARCLARCVSRNYITDCHTATFQWHLISSFYDYLPWPRCGVAVANEPWSGHYEITSPTWALAHTAQFAPIGWRYAAHGFGVGMLFQGGSYVTRVSPDRRDISIVVEKMSHDDSNCARGSNPPYDVSAENVTFILNGSFAGITSLNVWYSNLTDGNDSQQLFVHRGSIPVVNGRVTIEVARDDLFTLTTLSTGRKGSHNVPPASPFLLPYEQDFENETLYAPPRIWYTQMGAWEI